MENYKQIIAVFTSGKLSAKDYKNILVEIAKENPDVFLNAYSAVTPAERNCLIYEGDYIFKAVVKEYVETNSKLAAIKVYRRFTDSSLLDGKNYVEEKVIPHVENQNENT